MPDVERRKNAAVAVQPISKRLIELGESSHDGFATLLGPFRKAGSAWCRRTGLGSGALDTQQNDTWPRVERLIYINTSTQHQRSVNQVLRKFASGQSWLSLAPVVSIGSCRLRAKERMAWPRSQQVGVHWRLFPCEHAAFVLATAVLFHLVSAAAQDTKIPKTEAVLQRAW